MYCLPAQCKCCCVVYPLVLSQVLAEFNAEMPVILARPSGQITRTNMKALLPMAFLPTEVPFKKE